MSVFLILLMICNTRFSIEMQAELIYRATPALGRFLLKICTYSLCSKSWEKVFMCTFASEWLIFYDANSHVAENDTLLYFIKAVWSLSISFSVLSSYPMFAVSSLSLQFLRSVPKCEWTRNLTHADLKVNPLRLRWTAKASLSTQINLIGPSNLFHCVLFTRAGVPDGRWSTASDFSFSFGTPLCRNYNFSRFLAFFCHRHLGVLNCG